MKRTNTRSFCQASFVILTFWFIGGLYLWFILYFWPIRVVCKRVGYPSVNDVHGQISGVTVWRVSASAAGLRSTLSLSSSRTTKIHFSQKHDARMSTVASAILNERDWPTWLKYGWCVQTTSVRHFLLQASFKKKTVFSKSSSTAILNDSKGCSCLDCFF